MNKKILFVSGSLNRSGAQRVITLLAEEYVRRGWSVHIAVLLENKSGYDISEQIVIHDLVRRGNQKINVFKWIGDIKNLLSEIKPNVVVSFVGRINLITMIAARGSGIPVLVSERNDPAKDRRSRFERWLCKHFYARADKVVFQTRYQAKHYEKFCNNNSVIIGNPISALVYDKKHEKKDIICVGKLMDQKNHPMMIKAFRKIADEFPQTHVWIYGEGKKRNEIEALIKSEGLVNRIHLPGNSSSIFDIMHENEFFVMCSDYEGLSNALLEAMVSGMICITTTWSGVEEIVQDGINGYTVPVGDVDALTNKLRIVLKADNEKIRKNSIETGKQFSGDLILHKWCNTIDEIA